MNRLLIAKGVGKYFFEKSIPSKLRKQHVNILLEDENIRLSDKFQILLDSRAMEEYKKYWNLIFEPDIKKKHFREKYEIDINYHIKHFDPSGKTLGCGCALCGMFNRVKTKERSLNTLKSALNFINKIIELRADSKSNAQNLDFRTFYGKHNPEVLKFNGQSFINKTDDQLIKNIEDLLGRQVELESKLRSEKETLNKFSNLIGVPTKIESIEKIWKKLNFYKNKKKLIKNKLIDTLSLDECLNLTDVLGLYKINKKRLKNIRKELNRKPERYIIGTHLYTRTHDVYIPLLNKRVSIPKGISINRIVNEISDAPKQQARKSLNNIHDLTRTLLKNYQKKLLEKELKKVI